MEKVEVQACHILEKDVNGDILWTWSYPKVEEPLRSIYLRKCTFLFSRSTRFHAFHIGKSWVYVYFSEVFESEKLPQTRQVALVVSSHDYNPARYQTLCPILSRRYCKTGSPVQVLQLFLSVLTSGKCNTDDNGTYYLADFDIPSPLNKSQIANIIGRFGLESILIYNALLLKRRIAVYHHEPDELIKFVMSLPAFLSHRCMWDIIYPWVDAHPEELSLFQDSNLHILGFTSSSVENMTDLYDLYINIPASEITIAPHAKETMTMTKIHKDIAIFMVQLTHKPGITERDIISSINTKTTDLLRSIRTLGTIKDGNTVVTSEQAFLLSFARAEDAVVI